MKRISYFIVALALIFAVAPGVAGAATFQLGDVFSGSGNGNTTHFDKNGTLIETLNNTSASNEETGMAFDSAGNLYTTNWTASTISKYDKNGVLLSASIGGTDAGSHNESIIFDKSGNYFVGQADGTADILKFNSSGALIGRFDVATERRGSDWIDLAADQKTIYYTSEGGLIKRYDTSTNTQLADFANIGGTSFALRILGDGGVLVANSSSVKRLDSTGAVVQTYNVTGLVGFLFALNLDPDGKSFWTADYTSGRIWKVDIGTGATDFTFLDPNKVFSVAGLAVYGEITQGGPGNQVPEPGTMLLLGSGLIGLASLRKRLC